MTRLGILTSGGDCPGLNAVIRGAVLSGFISHGYDFVGFRDGWRGVLEGDVLPLPRHAVRGIAHLGGTVLGMSLTNPLMAGGVEPVRESRRRLGIDGLVAIGGEGTLAAAQELSNQGINAVGVPKTIDIDLDATNFTFGFDTAVQTATEAIERLRTRWIQRPPVVGGPWSPCAVPTSLTSDLTLRWAGSKPFQRTVTGKQRSSSADPWPALQLAARYLDLPRRGLRCGRRHRRPHLEYPVLVGSSDVLLLNAIG